MFATSWGTSESAHQKSSHHHCHLLGGGHFQISLRCCRYRFEDCSVADFGEIEEKMWTCFFQRNWGFCESLRDFLWYDRTDWCRFYRSSGRDKWCLASPNSIICGTKSSTSDSLPLAYQPLYPRLPRVTGIVFLFPEIHSEIIHSTCPELRRWIRCKECLQILQWLHNLHSLHVTTKGAGLVCKYACAEIPHWARLLTRRSILKVGKNYRRA